MNIHDCIEWPRAKNDKGYGQAWVRGRVQYVHRLMARIFWGDLGHLQVDHLCENPACCNPWHLVPRTAREHKRRHHAGLCRLGHIMVDVGTQGRRTCNECRNRRRRGVQA